MASDNKTVLANMLFQRVEVSGTYLSRNNNQWLSEHVS